ncbi:major facilitator superfamily domain-containing protein [Trichoderma ceciliae]
MTESAPRLESEKLDSEKLGLEYSHMDSRAKDSESNHDVSQLEDNDFGFTPAEQRSIIRRIDRRLVITVGAMYCVSLMDRTNMSAANIAGMSVELALINNRYNIANLVFFTTYIVFQPPSTILIRKIGPRLHLAFITLLWGGVMIGMGFVKNFHQLAALRTVLGVLEAGFFPSCVYLLSTWYTRYEVGKRYSMFYLLGCVASAFAGILAYGLMQLGGREGLSGWRWIFIIEGTITCALAIAGYWLLVDFPDSTRLTWSFLGQREREWIVHRIQRDRGDSKVPAFNLGKFLSGGADWKIWAYALIFFSTTTISYALAYTLPLILTHSMKFSVGESQCLVAPPYAFAGLVMFSTAWVGDRYHIRGPIIIFNMVLCLIGLPIMGWAPQAGVRYFGIFLVTAGANSNIPSVMSFQANNVRGQWKRALCSATLVGFGGIGGIAGSLVFREQDAATGYKPGMYACIACCLLSIVLVVLCDLDFLRQNKKADSQGITLEAHDEDASSDFRYTY